MYIRLVAWFKAIGSFTAAQINLFKNIFMQLEVYITESKWYNF